MTKKRSFTFYIALNAFGLKAINRELMKGTSYVHTTLYYQKGVITLLAKNLVASETQTI